MNEFGWAPTELLARLAASGAKFSPAPGGKPRFTMEDIAGALAGLPTGPYLLARVKYCSDSEDELRRSMRATKLVQLNHAKDDQLAEIEKIKNREEISENHASMFISSHQLEIEEIDEAISCLKHSAEMSLTRRMFCREAEMAAMTLVVRRKWKGEDSIYRKMTQEAIRDVLSNHKCRTCEGTGRNRDMPSKACPVCTGTGNRNRLNDHTEMAARCAPDIKPDAWRMTWAPRYREILGIFQGWDEQIESHLLRKMYKKD